MARHSPDTNIDPIQWQSLHYVACDSWLGPKFRVRGNCPSEKSLRMERGNVYVQSFLFINMESIFIDAGYRQRKMEIVEQFSIAII